MQTYKHILTILSNIEKGLEAQQWRGLANDNDVYNYPNGLLAVELSNRLPSTTRPFVNQCLQEMVDRQLIRYSDEYTGPYRYRITSRGKRYFALFL